MTPEERLRQLLHEHDEVPVSGDGLARIRARLDARRRRRLVPAAAMAGVLAVAAAVGISMADGGTARLHPEPVPPAASFSPSPVASPSPMPTPSPSASPTPVPSGVTTSGGGMPVWPFASNAQAAAWQADPGTRAWASEPVQVAQHLLDDFLDLTGTAVGTDTRGPVTSAVVKVAGRPVCTVRLEQVGGPDGPWSVTGAVAEDLAITSPRPETRVPSPLMVTGTVTGYDESVHVQLRANAGRELAAGYAMAGAERPWTQRLAWTDENWTTGALVASTFDGKGDLHALVLLPVRNG
ncbi:MAG: Gmad2 immunoglobulin-like domain-containing protein [Actinobacteria bacterium]|nr:Gmad2 immunoglobulin-like domain-containing protein [Actinomycetota bacterium]MCA1721797.1 Gmad2 immunoglobulin-like domain-containing protein [Actinomycetota bacterium]